MPNAKLIVVGVVRIDVIHVRLSHDLNQLAELMEACRCKIVRKNENKKSVTTIHLTIPL